MRVTLCTFMKLGIDNLEKGKVKNMGIVSCGKKAVAIFAVALCASVSWAEGGENASSLAEARQKISQVIEDSSLMTEVMKTLSPSDQVTFLGEVNAAIARMPGSAEARAAMFLNVDSAALRSAKEGNLSALVAEVFATASVETLPILSERFAEDLFNRDSAQISDAQFVKIAEATMSVVNSRTENVDSGDVRSTFAALMFIRASNSSADEIFNPIAAMLPEKSREVATKEWLPEALGKDGKEQSYDPLFAVANGGIVPEIVRTLEIAGPQFQGVLLTDLTGFNTEPFAKASERAPVTDAIFNPHHLGRPIGGNDSMNSAGKPINPEPVPYPGQRTK